MKYIRAYRVNPSLDVPEEHTYFAIVDSLPESFAYDTDLGLELKEIKEAWVIPDDNLPKGYKYYILTWSNSWDHRVNTYVACKEKRRRRRRR